MPQFIRMKSIFYGMFGPIGALAAILELVEYVESSPNKRLLSTPLAIYMLNIFVSHHNICNMSCNTMFPEQY